MSKINKIIELQVETDDLEFESEGISIMSLVEEPAIGVHWAVFAAEQFVDRIAGESKDDYIGRCIPQLISEGYDEEQAAAICYSSFEEVERNDKEMVDGIIDLLNKVESLDNRMKMAKDVIKDFEEEGVAIDIVDFMNRLGFHHFEIDDTGLPEYVDQGTEPTAKEIEEIEKKIIAMASQNDFGEILDVSTTTYVNLSKTNFETVGDYLRGINALEILETLVGTGYEEVPEPKYFYSGPPAERVFCRALLGLGKYYTKDEINALGAFNTGFAEKGKSYYSVWKYAGGVNCRHFWSQARIFRASNGQKVVIDEGPVPGLPGKSENRRSPSPTGYVPNNARVNFSTSNSWQFAEDDDQRIITGPAMKSFQLIPRRDEKGNLFHVYFTDKTIKKLSEKFLKEHKQNMTDIDHSMKPTEENTLLESWIVEDPEMDKSRALGFNPSKGDWYVSYKINNDETWQKIKDGSLQGFSIAGEFIERATKV